MAFPSTRTLVALVLGAVLAASGAGAADGGTARSTATVWQMQTVTLPTHGNGKGWQAFAEALSQKTNGQIELKVRFGSGLGFNPAQMVSLTSRHAVDVGELIGSFVEADFPEGTLASVPGVVPYGVKIRKKVAAALAPYYTRILKDKGQVYLGYCQADPRAIMSKKPVRTLADLKGLKIRATGEQEVQLTKDLGANPIEGIVAGELYTALQTGVVDAVWGPNSFFLANKFDELAKYVINIDVGGPTNLWTVNKDAFNGIPASQQLAVRAAAAKGLDTCWTEVDNGYRDAARQLKAKGVAVAELSRADQATIARLTNPLGAQWAATHGPNAPAMLATLRRVLGSQDISAGLSPKQQVPAPTGVKPSTRAELKGSLGPTETGAVLEWALTFRGLTGPITSVDLKRTGAGGKQIQIARLCSKKCTSGKTGSANLLTAAYTALKKGTGYVVVSTKKNPTGEVRGSLKIASSS